MKYWLPVAVCALVAACAGEAVRPTVENLDERTGVTVASLQQPIDFIELATPSVEKHSSHCYLGPVEWDRMGNVSYGLWLHVAPGNDQPVGDIQRESAVSLVDDQGTLVLRPHAAPKLGREPYARVVPWGQTAWFELSADTLARLAASHRLEVVLGGTDATPVVFAPVEAPAPTLAAFARSRGITVD